MLREGETLGNTYRILREIGSGGTGIIYLALHLRLNTHVVVKKVKDDFKGHLPERTEADILKRLHHAYLPQVYDFLVIDGSVYTVMEYIEGYNLQQYLDAGYTFPEETLRKWLIQLADVLSYLHTSKPPILHSDIKPANIMITPNGNVCLIDFNVSLDSAFPCKLQGLSPWYAAPEQYQLARAVLSGQEETFMPDARMDIYSLGAVFMRLFTGLLPSPAEDQSEALLAMDIPYSQALKAIVSKMIRPIARDRFQTAASLKAALEHMAKADPKYRRYTRLQIGNAALWWLCVIAGLSLIFYGRYRYAAESWQEDYISFYEAAQGGNETEIISRGTKMLNNRTYRPYLKRNPDKEAAVFNELGDCYYLNEQYEEAADYYKEAVSLDEDNEDYIENYATALAMSGDSDSFNALLKEDEDQSRLSQEKRDLLTICLSWKAHEESEAKTESELEALAESLKNGQDSETAAKAYVLLSRLYLEEDETVKAVSALEEAKDLSDETEILRQLGEASYAAAMESERKTDQNAYLRKAYEAYLTLESRDNPSYEDALNLALTERALGKYESSNQTLLDLKSDYAGEYVIPMWMCYNYLSLLKEEEDSTMQSELTLLYKEAISLYKVSGETNENMEKLKETMEE